MKTNSLIFKALSPILFGACSNRHLAPPVVKNDALADANAVFQREGIPSVAKIGGAASYGYVLVNMLGQTPDF